MSPKLGRPTSDNPKHIRVEIRMAETDIEKLDFCCEIAGKSRSEILRTGVDRVYTELKNLNEK